MISFHRCTGIRYFEAVEKNRIKQRLIMQEKKRLHARLMEAVEKLLGKEKKTSN